MLADILAQLQQKQASVGESGVTAAFELNWESLEPEAQKLACLLSLFALAPIPWSLVESAASACNLEFDIKASCTILIQRYLVQQLAENTYQIHERIRELLRLKLEDLAEVETHHSASLLKRGFCQAMVAVARDIPQTPTQIAIAKASLAIPHLAEAATAHQNWLGDEDLIWVFVGLSRFYEGQKAYAQALTWLKKSLSATRKRFGEQHPDVNSLQNSALKKVLSDARLNELALAAKTAVVSNERKLALNLLVEAIYIADRFYLPNNASFSLPPSVYEYVYNEALQITLLEICQNIDNYNPKYDVMAWVNFLLSRRFSDVRNKYVRHGIRELPRDSQNPVVSLNEPETIEKFSRKDEAYSKLQEIRELIEEDPDNIFTKEHIDNRSDATFKVIALKKIFKEKTWENISEELRIPVPTLRSFYHRCLKKFRNYFQEYLQE